MAYSDMDDMTAEPTSKVKSCVINNHDYEGGYIQPGIVPEGEVGSVSMGHGAPEFQPDWAYSMSHFLKREKLSGGGDPYPGKAGM